MTNEKINVAIAQECGWKFPCEPCAANGIKNRWRRPTNDGCRDQTQLPDYCNDLNAMHEAEKGLTEDQRWEQACLIVGYRVAPAGFPLFRRSEVIALASATARQRAEAFLRTLGKWKE